MFPIINACFVTLTQVSTSELLMFFFIKFQSIKASWCVVGDNKRYNRKCTVTLYHYCLVNKNIWLSVWFSI